MFEGLVELNRQLLLLIVLVFVEFPRCLSDFSEMIRVLFRQLFSSCSFKLECAHVVEEAGEVTRNQLRPDLLHNL